MSLYPDTDDILTPMFRQCPICRRFGLREGFRPVAWTSAFGLPVRLRPEAVGEPELICVGCEHWLDGYGSALVECRQRVREARKEAP